jgi:hypothetical protein
MKKKFKFDMADLVFWVFIIMVCGTLALHGQRYHRLNIESSPKELKVKNTRNFCLLVEDINKKEIIRYEIYKDGKVRRKYYIRSYWVMPNITRLGKGNYELRLYQIDTIHKIKFRLEQWR